MPGFVASLDDDMLRHLVETLTESGQAICLYDAEDRLRYANKTYQDLFVGGYEGPFTFPAILRYAHQHGLGVRIDDGDVEAFIARTLARRRTVPRKSFQTDLVNGRWFWMDHTILPNGWLLTVGADITALKHDERSLRQAHDAALLASRTDVLTGLPNRRYILEILDERLGADKHEGSSLCVALIDIDWFKAINDRYGHDVGDAVLRHFSQVCRERLSPEISIGRTGGEEFLIVLPASNLEAAARAVNQLRTDFPPAIIGEGAVELVYTFSAGVTAALPQDTRSSILQRADRALYAAKADGRNGTRAR
jgi:diguanylate cyclase (GGDEF)-like protein